MNESFDRSIAERKTEQRTGGLTSTWNDRSEPTNHLFAKTTSSANLDNLDTASLYGSSDTSSHAAFAAGEISAKQRVSHHKSLDDHGSFSEHHSGPKPEDNYDLRYNHKDNSTLVSRILPNGDRVQTLHKGHDTTSPAEATRITHPNHDWEMTCGSDSQLSSAKYISSEKKTIQNYKDGTVVSSFFDGDSEENLNLNHTETVQKEGGITRTTSRDPVTSSYTADERDAKGNVIKHTDRTYSNDGGYSESGGYVKDGKLYDYSEKFDASSGTTKRVDTARDSNKGTTTTTTGDGNVTVDLPDGTKKTSKIDGSETVVKDGITISEKPAYDYQHNAEVNKSRDELNKTITDHVPANKQAEFKKDMVAFEERAAKDHLSPEEITKSYQQMSKMLNAPEAVVSSENRALLAESMMHQLGNPKETRQGKHNTCNVTSVAETTLVRNPSKAVEMAATTAVEGKWTAPDGKVISIEKESLTPGPEEKTYPPVGPYDRSYATQVLNLVMVNDALQRRDSPQTYVQGAVEDHAKKSGDTGERIKDSSGTVIKDPAGKPISGPDITDNEIAQESKRLNGASSHVLVVDEGQGSTDSVSNENQLKHRLGQFKAQGQFPITLGVDGDHWPIAGIEHPGFGGHVVTIDDYNPITGKVHVTNEWGKKDNRWTNVAELWLNASGDTSKRKDGVDQSWN